MLFSTFETGVWRSELLKTTLFIIWNNPHNIDKVREWNGTTPSLPAGSIYPTKMYEPQAGNFGWIAPLVSGPYWNSWLLTPYQLLLCNAVFFNLSICTSLPSWQVTYCKLIIGPLKNYKRGFRRFQCLSLSKEILDFNHMWSIFFL